MRTTPMSMSPSDPPVQILDGAPPRADSGWAPVQILHYMNRLLRNR